MALPSDSKRPWTRSSWNRFSRETPGIRCGDPVVANRGDFVIAVKDNQPKLKAAVEAFFHEQIERDFEDLQDRRYETHDAGHGRIDERAYFLARTPRDFAPSDDWPEVKAIG
jgi:hypothetical protein